MLRRFDLQTHLNKLAAKYSKSIVAKAKPWTRAVLEEPVEQEYLVRYPARKLAMPPTRPTCKRFLRRPSITRCWAYLMSATVLSSDCSFCAHSGPVNCSRSGGDVS